MTDNPRLDLDRIIDDRRTRIIVCCGSGGVGKTTTAAAIGLRAAEQHSGDLVQVGQAGAFECFGPRSLLVRLELDRFGAGFGRCALGRRSAVDKAGGHPVKTEAQ